MNKSIVFTIKTAYSREKYFLELNEGTENPWEIKDQIETALISKMCFCDAYDLVKYKEVDEKYIAKREKAIKELESIINDTCEEYFCCGEEFVTLEALRDSIRYEEERQNKPTLREFLDGAEDDYIIEIYYGETQGFSGTYEELKKHKPYIMHEKVLSYDADDSGVNINL
nr:MAG TPA: hypothetical protein [Bacteriophage sp.]